MVTLQIDPVAVCRDTATSMDGGNLVLRQVDGTFVTVSDELRQDLISIYADEAWLGDPIPADSLAGELDLHLDVCTVAPDLQTAPAVPSGRPLGVFRDVYLDGSGSDGSTLAFETKLPRLLQVTLHYPQAWVPAGADENKIGLYEYNDRSDRWVLMGGHVNPTGNNVTIRTDHTGTFGLFHSQAIDYNPDEVVSGVLISPSPFSPNDDGLYDETNISFYLNQEATVTLEVYNIEGRRHRRITETFPFSGEDDENRIPRRVPGFVWDGTNHRGDRLPYGIYIMRLIVTYNQAGGQRTIRSNHAVAVIR